MDEPNHTIQKKAAAKHYEMTPKPEIWTAATRAKFKYMDARTPIMHYLPFSSCYTTN
jgi:hypothetical protein